MPRGKSKKPGSPMPAAPPPVQIPTARDAGSGLLYGKDQNGNLYRVTPEEFSKGGYLPVDDATAQGHKANELAVNQIGPEALALQAARGASARLLDIPATAIAGPEYAKYLERADERYGGAGDVAEGVGMVAPLLLTGGTGALARAGTAAGGLEAAGQLAGRGVAGVAGKGALSTAAQFGVEGAGWAASHELSRQTLKGGPTDYDKLWSATGGGLLFGGVLGAGFGAAGRFLGARKAAQDTASKFSAKHTGEEAATVAKAQFGDELAPELEAFLSGKQPQAKPGFSEKLASLGNPGRVDEQVLASARADPEVAKRFLPDVREGLLQGYTRDISGGLQGVNDVVDVAHANLSGGRKAKVWDEWTKGVDPNTLRQAYAPKLLEFADEIEGNIARTIETEGGGAIIAGSPLATKVSEGKRLSQYLRQTVDEMAQGTLTSGDIAFKTNSAVRYMQSQMRKKGGVVNSWDDMMQSFAKHSDPRIEGSVARMLEDESVLGRAGVANKEVNAAYHDAMLHREHLDGFFEASNVPNPMNEYRPLARVNEAAVHALVKNIDDPQNWRKVLDLKQAAESQLKFHDTMRRHVDFAAPELKKLTAADEGIKKFSGMLDRAANDVKLMGQIQSMQKADPHTWARIMGAMVGGGVVGGPVGGIIGFGLGSRLSGALNPYQSIATAAQLRRMVNVEDGWRGWLVDKLAGTKWSGKSGALREVPEVTRAVSQGSSRKLGAAARVMLYDAFREDGDSDAKSYEKALGQLRLAAANPDLVRSGIAAAMGDAADMYPDAVEHMTQKTMLAAQVLSAYAPPPAEGDTMFSHWWRMEPTDDQLTLFEDIWEGVVTPRAALSRAADLDDISPEVVDVMDMLHPAYMGEFRADLQQALAELDKPPGENKLRAISIIFKMALTPSMEPAYIDQMQDAHEMRTALEEKAGGKGYRDRRTFKSTGVNQKSRTDKLEEGFGSD